MLVYIFSFRIRSQQVTTTPNKQEDRCLHLHLTSPLIQTFLHLLTADFLLDQLSLDLVNLTFTELYLFSVHSAFIEFQYELTNFHQDSFALLAAGIVTQYSRFIRILVHVICFMCLMVCFESHIRSYPSVFSFCESNFH